jgi:hypothetical protein
MRTASILSNLTTVAARSTPLILNAVATLAESLASLRKPGPRWRAYLPDQPTSIPPSGRMMALSKAWKPPPGMVVLMRIPTEHPEIR